eukprot:scaffold7007_cov146-Amphora_coffeaeformis.AAC.5
MKPTLPLVLTTFWLLLVAMPVSSLATTPATNSRSILVTGANKGQGYALCERILAEHDDTYVFLCSRDKKRGQAAIESLVQSNTSAQDRVELVPLDVTDEASVQAAMAQVQKSLAADNNINNKLYGVVSNAGILWGHSLAEQFTVNTVGVCRVLDQFLPLLDPQEGRLIVVSSGLGPLMHGFSSAERQKALKSPDLTFDDISQMMEACLQNETAEGLESVGFPGGPFADAAPDFHKYGLAKMFTDAYMLRLARQYPALRINSCDPGLVYTDLILKMPKYQGKSQQESGAKSPAQGVEAVMRLLFGPDVADDDELSLPLGGLFYAMNKERTKLLKSTIDVQPKE